MSTPYLEDVMEPSERGSDIDRRLRAIKRPEGATEPQLTACMAVILGADPAASAAVARALLHATPNLPDDGRMRRTPDRLQVSAEHPYTYTGHVRRRSSDHRIDLVWRSQDGRWALVAEAKLRASFAKGQLEHMPQVPAEKLRLSPDAAVGVIALTAKSHAFGHLKDPHKRWLGEVRWVEILDAFHDIRFDDATIEERWHELLTVYTGRKLFGSQAVSRPSARTALEYTARGTCDHLSTRLGPSVELMGDRARHAVLGGARDASVSYRFTARHRRRLLTIRLRRPKGGRRAFSLHLSPGNTEHHGRSCPAELGAFQTALHAAIDAVLEESRLV